MAGTRIQHWAAGWAGWASVSALGLTWDHELVDPENVMPGIRSGSSPIVGMFWHRHIIPLIVTFRNTRVVTAVSRSSDGEFVAQVMERFKIRQVRGSTSRGAVGVLRQMVRMGEEGWTTAITPDGPRGPIYTVQPGFAVVAQRCGLPVYPVGAATDREWTLNSWDRFVIPKPGARVVVAFGGRLDAGDYPSREAFCTAMRDALFAASETAERCL